MNNSSSSASGKKNSEERETILTDKMKEAEEAISAFQGSLDSSSSSQTKYSLNKNNNNVHSISLHKETLYSLHGISTSPGTFLFSLSLSLFIFLSFHYSDSYIFKIKSIFQTYINLNYSLCSSVPYKRNIKKKKKEKGVCVCVIVCAYKFTMVLSFATFLGVGKINNFAYCLDYGNIE